MNENEILNRNENVNETPAQQPVQEKIQTEPTPFAGPDAAEPTPPPVQTAPPQAQQNYNEPPQYTQPQYTQPPQYTPGQQGTQYNYYQQPQPAPQPVKTYYNVAPAGYQQKSRLAAGLLGILFGMFGVHNFYLGFTSRATLQLVITIVGLLLSVVVIGIFAVLAMAIWGFIEGVQILTANNPNRLYDANCVILRT